MRLARSPLREPRSPPLPPTTSSFELLAKFEQLHLTYASSSRGGAPDAKSPDGDINVDVVSFGATYWITRRVRLSLDYDLNIFPGSEPGTPSAVAPSVDGATWSARAAA